MSKLKPIVTDTYDFPTLIRDGYVYVDKTALLARLISKADGRCFFIYGKTARAALKQINEKGYAKPYAAGRRRVVAIGVNYDPRKAGTGVVSEVVNPSDEVVNSVDEVVNEVVKSHPGLRKPELVPLVGKSRATVERVLASLIATGRIEFRGAPKNGGYYVR